MARTTGKLYRYKKQQPKEALVKSQICIIEIGVHNEKFMGEIQRLAFSVV